MIVAYFKIVIILVLLEESKLSIAQRLKDNLGLRQNETKPDSHQVTQSRPMVRPRTSRRRSLSAIRSSGIYDDDLYVHISI